MRLHWNSYFFFISNPKQFFLVHIWLYLLPCITYFGCCKHHVQFLLILNVTIILMCFVLVVLPFPSALPLFWLSCMLKPTNLMPKNSMCPILPLNKNYLTNNLEVPEWQDVSWSGNCWSKCIFITSVNFLPSIKAILRKTTTPVP